MSDKNEKRVNPNRYYWNPETKEKIHTHYLVTKTDEFGRKYTDNVPIELNDGQKAKAKLAAEACTRRALKQHEAPIARRKPKHKILGHREKPKEEAKKSEVKK